MRIIKIIIGVAYLLAAFWLALFAVFSFHEWGSLFVALIPVIYFLCLIASGWILIKKWRSPVSKHTRLFIILTTGIIVASCAIMDIHIRQDRKALQTRAKAFLLRPVPSILDTNSIDGYQARENETVLSGSRAIIQRYAKNGRIRYSAAIAGQFATQPFETASCEEADVVKTNEKARLYVADCKSIIDEEWRMMFWQWVEDTMEMRFTVPEIEEENRVDRFVEQLYYTWTNATGTMTISPNGLFSARFVSQNQTNNYEGTHVFVVKDGVLAIMPANANEEIFFKIIRVDEHNLIYGFGGQTNTMRR